MRTLSEITVGIRSGGEYTEDEARYAVVAYDVLLAQLSLDMDPVRQAEYVKAAETSPIEYVGRVNDPANPASVEWYKAMSKVWGRPR